MHNKQTPAASEQNPLTYKVDKMTFIVSPVYRESDGKTIPELLLNLMLTEADKSA